MVVLTIVTQKNGDTVYLDESIPQVHFMKLVSCSLYNSWHNLKKEGSAVLGDEKKDPSVSIGKINPGHYTLESMAQEIANIFKSYGERLNTKTNTPFGQLEITNFGTKPIKLDRDLAELFGVKRELDRATHVGYLSYTTSYFIHCNLIDKQQNFFNNKRSDLLAKLDVRGKPYEKVSYEAYPQQPLRDCSTSLHVNSITVSVRDENGELFDFNGFPLEFVLEIN